MGQIVIKKLSELKQQISKINPQKVFLIRGKKSYSATGGDRFIDMLLENIEYTSFSDFNINPQLKDLQKGIALFKQGNYELIVAIGGGSVLDMAKLISVFAHQNNDLESIVLGKAQITDNKTQLLSIPTTAGTGAEATHFAVVYIDKVKYSVAHSAILPNYVYLSSEFSMSANKYLTACTGLDAFCQAVESVWSVNATTESQVYALKAIELIWENLQKAVLENNKPAKEQMLEASFLAGKAINITKTTAPHAISYAFTSYYDIPHGHAVALSLPFFMNYNYDATNTDCNDKRGALAVRARINKVLDVLGIDIEESNNKIEIFFNSIGISISISEIITKFDKNVIINNVNTERLSNNPRYVTKEVLGKIFSK